MLLINTEKIESKITFEEGNTPTPQPERYKIEKDKKDLWFVIIFLIVYKN